MNKQDLIDAVSSATGDSKVTTAQIIDAFTDIVTTSLAKGEAVQLIGFGTFGRCLVKRSSVRSPSASCLS